MYTYEYFKIKISWSMIENICLIYVGQLSKCSFHYNYCSRLKQEKYYCRYIHYKDFRLCDVFNELKCFPQHKMVS